MPYRLPYARGRSLARYSVGVSPKDSEIGPDLA